MKGPCAYESQGPFGSPVASFTEWHYPSTDTGDSSTGPDRLLWTTAGHRDVTGPASARHPQDTSGPRRGATMGAALALGPYAVAQSLPARAAAPDPVVHDGPVRPIRLRTKGEGPL